MSAREVGRRGRPTREEERAITFLILEAALRLFLENGYGATSMKRIGEAAGVAPNTLYARFPSKEELFRAITEWKVALWKVTNPPRQASVGAPLREVLEVAILSMFDAMEREDISAIGRLLMLEAARFPELAAIYHEIAVSVGHDSLVNSIVSAEGSPLSAEEAAEMATTILETTIGCMHLRMLANGRDVESHRKAAARIARVFADRGIPSDAQVASG